jgi:hypothetical protein
MKNAIISAFAVKKRGGRAEPFTADEPGDQQHALLTQEVKLGCTLGLLQCLDRPHRLAYVLGEVFEWAAPDTAAALDIEPAAFRKRLQRARQAVEEFTRAHCGLVSDTAACACHRRVPAALGRGRVDPEQLRFAQAGVTFAQAREFIQQVEVVRRVVVLQQTTSPAGPARDLAQLIAAALLA